jgi:predicted MFS family arabinose efflux permease
VHLEIVGPTLNVLAYQTGVAYSGISTIFVARGVGYISGNIFGTLIQNVVNKYPEGVLSIAFLIASIGLLIK